MLREHGQPDAGVIERLAACFDDPFREQGSEKWTVLLALFGVEAFHAPSLRSDDFCPRHDLEFRSLCARVAPPVEVAAVTQPGLDDDDWVWVPGPHELQMSLGHGRTTTVRFDGPIRQRRRPPRGQVRYLRDGLPQAFEFNVCGSWMDFDAVLFHANALLGRIGHAQRLFEFAPDADDHPAFPVLIAGDAARFPGLCAQLGLPLRAREVPVVV
ncbi:MAG: hypothetical protein MUE46_00180 [Xanthomonadales bacterium]|nr:hypothetical protein [Xanthomonadales bacterium]